MKSSTLVVGGGIAGIVAALRARRRGDDVTLIEKEPVLGGLLTSVRPGDGKNCFDHGTHVPAPTGNAELDEVLFASVRNDAWTTFPVLKAATYWNGRLGAESPCLDLRTLGPTAYAAVLREMLSPARVTSGVPENLGCQLAEAYGPAMVRCVFEPVLRRFFNEGVDALAVDAHLLFGLSRFVCAEAAQVRELKRNPGLDRKLAFHSYRETVPGSHGAAGFYPREGGAGRWIDGLEAQLQEAGVTIRTGVATKTIDLAAGRAVLGDERELTFDRMVWSLPPGILLRACRHPVARELSAPRMAAITLFHVVTDRAPTTDAYYVTCYDPARRPFRVTLYRNLQPHESGAARITVEVLNPVAGQTKPSPAEIFTELKEMGLVARDAACSACHVQEIPHGFPIQTMEQQRGSQLAAETVEREFWNVTLLGRAAGRRFFTKDVLLHAWSAA
jgi:protoporphyrinogen oxidase